MSPLYHSPGRPHLTQRMDEEMAEKFGYVLVSESRGDRQAGDRVYRAKLRRWLAGDEGQAAIQALSDYFGLTRWYAPKAGQVFHLNLSCSRIGPNVCDDVEEINDVTKLPGELFLRDCRICGSGWTEAEEDRGRKEIAAIKTVKDSYKRPASSEAK